MSAEEVVRVLLAWIFLLGLAFSIGIIIPAIWYAIKRKEFPPFPSASGAGRPSMPPPPPLSDDEWLERERFDKHREEYPED